MKIDKTYYKMNVDEENILSESLEYFLKNEKDEKKVQLAINMLGSIQEHQNKLQEELDEERKLDKELFNRECMRRTHEEYEKQIQLDKFLWEKKIEIENIKNTDR